MDPGIDERRYKNLRSSSAPLTVLHVFEINSGTTWQNILKNFRQKIEKRRPNLNFRYSFSIEYMEGQREDFISKLASTQLNKLLISRCSLTITVKLQSSEQAKSNSVEIVI